MARPRVLVTGATGFLGGAVCAELRAAGGWEVTATGRDAGAGARVAADHFQPGDLTTTGTAAALATGMEAIVHCAALASPWGRREEFERANVGATRALLAAAEKAGVRRFVHVSSPAIYAEFAHREGLTESSPLPARPINDYARTKLAGERLVRAAADRLETVVLRPHALLGVGDRVLLPRLVRAAARGRLPVIGDGRTRTDLCCVENAARACRLALEAPADRVRGEAFNVANGEPVPLWDTLRAFLREAGLPGPRGRVPFRLAWAAAALLEGWSHAVSGREPAMTRYGAAVLAFSHTFDLTKARQGLGYAPEVPLSAGLARAARWWRDRRAAGEEGVSR